MGKQEEERRFSTSLRRKSHRRRSQLPTTSISSQRSFYGCPRHTQSDSKSCPSTGYLSSPTPTLPPTTPSETLDPPSQPFISTEKEHPSPSPSTAAASVSRLSPPSSMVSENLLELRLYTPATAYCCAVIVTSQSVVMVRDGNTLSVIRPQSNTQYFLFRIHLSHTIVDFTQRLTGMLIWLLILQDHLTTKFCCLGMCFDSLLSSMSTALRENVGIRFSQTKGIVEAVSIGMEHSIY